MPKVDFRTLPDDARVWVFGTDRPLDSAEERRLLAEVDAFVEGWKAHGAPLRAARDWRHGRFLLVAVDEASVPPSGCSIDAMVRLLQEVGGRLGVDLVDKTPVWFREGGKVRRVSRPDFRRLVQEGVVGPETVVFDPTITRMGDVRSGAWERPAAQGWHGRAFFRTAAARTVPDRG